MVDKMDHGDHFSRFGDLLAAEIRAGHSVEILDSHDNTFKNWNLLAEPGMLGKLQHAGLKHLSLEMDKSILQGLTDLPAGSSQDEMAEILRDEGVHAIPAKIIARLEYNAKAHGIALESPDRQNDTINLATAKLTPSEKTLFFECIKSAQAEFMSSDSSKGSELDFSAQPKALDSATPAQRRHVTAAFKTLMERRSQTGDGSDDNDYIVSRLKETTHGEPVIDMHGALHSLGVDDLNEKLAQATNRQVTTVMIAPGDRATRIVDRLMSHRAVVDIPDYLYYPAEDRLEKLSGVPAADPACHTVAGWANGCREALALPVDDLSIGPATHAPSIDAPASTGKAREGKPHSRTSALE